MKFFSALIALALVSSTAFAEDGFHPAGRFGLGVGGGVPIPVNYSTFRNSASTGWMVQGHGDYYFTDGMGIEAEYQHLNYKTGNPLNNFYTLGLNWRWVPGAVFTPVFGFGAGWGFATAKAGLDGETSGFLGNAKLGLDYACGDSFVVELAAKYSWLFSKNSGSNDEQALVPEINATWFFGANKKKDGVEEVAYKPSATPAPTPMATPVDGDDDQDGVPNSMDKCPNTPAGAKVNSFGCQVNEAVNEKIDIQFANGKSTIPADYTSEADKIVQILKDHSDVKAEIEGYTDNVGSKNANKKLSAARANSVRKYIIKQGVESSRVISKGFGEEDPVADNATEDGRKANRRVIAKLTSKGNGPRGHAKKAVEKASKTGSDTQSDSNADSKAE